MSRFVPAGSYVVHGTTALMTLQSCGHASFSLYAGTTQHNSRIIDFEDVISHAVPLLTTVTFPNGGTLEITCRTTQDGIYANGANLVAVKVNALR